MESLYILIPLSVVAVLLAVVVFFLMSRSGQFDDDQGPAWSILLDDDRPDSHHITQGKNQTNDSVDLDQSSR